MRSGCFKSADGRVLIQPGLAKEKALPGVPLLRELASDARDQEVLDYVSKVVAIGRSVATTPRRAGGPVAALRQAFDLTLADAEFIAEAEKLKAEVAKNGIVNFRQPSESRDRSVVAADQRDVAKTTGALMEIATAFVRAPAPEKFTEALSY